MTGVAANRGEWIPGLSGVVAPVFHAGVLAGCVAVAGSSPRLDALDAELGPNGVVDRMRAAAEAVAARLGGLGLAGDSS